MAGIAKRATEKTKARIFEPRGTVLPLIASVVNPEARVGAKKRDRQTKRITATLQRAKMEKGRFQLELPVLFKKMAPNSIAPPTRMLVNNQFPNAVPTR